jgi:hypothetical protein
MTPQETNRRVQASLEGKCVHCGGLYPRHIGLCHIKTKQLQLNFEERTKDRQILMIARKYR